MKTSLWALAAIAVLTLVVRIPNWLERPLGAYSDNEDAASHVLATALAYDQVDAAEHHFLPVFTLGAPHDLWIDNLPTASRMSTTGHNYYTSWPPGFFVIAWSVPHIFGASPSPVSLRALNLFLQYLSVALLAALCFALAADAGGTREARWAASIAGSLVYLSAPEALKSHLFSYWGQQVYQPILLLQLLLFLRGRGLPSATGVATLGFLGHLIDWTSYVSSAGFSLAYLWRYYRERRPVLLGSAAVVIAAALLGAAVLFAWFTSKLSLHELVEAQSYRASVRTGSLLDYLRLLVGYAFSLGAWLLVAAMLLPAILRLRAHKTAPGALAKVGPTLFAAGFPILENLMLANHASMYSYDRLKAVAFFGILLAALIGAAALPIRRVLMLSFGAAAISIVLFAGFYHLYRPPTAAILQQHKALGEIIKQSAGEDEIAFLNQTVRGHNLFYAERNIVELNVSHRSEKSAITPLVRAELARRGFQNGVVYLIQDDAHTVSIMHFRHDDSAADTTISLKY